MLVVECIVHYLSSSISCFLFFLEAGRVPLVNGTSSRKFGDDFEIDIVADCVRASMDEKRLRVGCILGRIIQLSRAYKGI